MTGALAGLHAAHGAITDQAGVALRYTRGDDVLVKVAHPPQGGEDFGGRVGSSCMIGETAASQVEVGPWRLVNLREGTSCPCLAAGRTCRCGHGAMTCHSVLSQLDLERELPAVLAASVSQINTLIDTILASTLVTGSISWLYYSDRLMEVPIGLVAVALGTVLLPNLSRLDAAGERAKFSASLDWGLRLGMGLGLPAAMALYVLALPLISTIYLRGALTELDARMAALSLQAFSFGVVALVLVKVLAPAYFARQDTRTPFRIGAIAVATNIVLNLALFSWFGHVGLALATAVAAWVNALLLLHGLERRGIYVPGIKLGIGLARASVATAVMGAVLWWWIPADNVWLQAADAQRFFWLGEAVGLGAFCYLGVWFILGERPKNLLLRV